MPGKGKSGSGGGLGVMVPRRLLNEMLRRMAGVGPMLMGLATACRMSLANEMFSNRSPGWPWNLIGHPKT